MLVFSLTSLLSALLFSLHFTSLSFLLSRTFLSLFIIMSRLGDFDYLHGTKVTLEHSSPSPSATFVLDDKLSEEFQTMTQEEHDDDLGHPFAALNFSCHNLLDPTQQSFIRFYYQIPIDGTIYHSPSSSSSASSHSAYPRGCQGSHKSCIGGEMKGESLMNSTVALWRLGR